MAGDDRTSTGSHLMDQRFQLLVNASPVGMAGDARSPIDIRLLRPHHTVAEVVMTPPLTPFLREAERQGCTIHPGRQVLDGQLDLMLDFFR